MHHRFSRVQILLILLALQDHADFAPLLNESRSVVDCGSPLPLFSRTAHFVAGVVASPAPHDPRSADF